MVTRSLTRRGALERECAVAVVGQLQPVRPLFERNRDRVAVGISYDAVVDVRLPGPDRRWRRSLEDRRRVDLRLIKRAGRGEGQRLGRGGREYEAGGRGRIRIYRTKRLTLNVGVEQITGRIHGTNHNTVIMDR